MARSLEYLVWRAMDKLHIPYYVFSSGSFELGGVTRNYLYHRKNLTWSNERCVEIALAMGFVRPSKKVLEVGNVLNQYMYFEHDVVDLYEKEDGVINEDMCHYDSKERYDEVVCISTLEHIHDYKLAIANMKRLLAPDGRMLVTYGLGQHTEMDADDMHKYFSQVQYMRRVGRLKWVEVDKVGDDAVWSGKYPGSNYLFIGRI